MNKTKPPRGFEKAELDARPFLPLEPGSLPVGTWGSPTLTLGGDLELTKALFSLAGEHQDSNAFRGEWEGRPA